MKAIMISVQPKWVAKILNGQKTMEIRKTMPKCDLPIDVYIYCTSHKKHTQSLAIVYSDDEFILNGKVVAKFTLKELYRIIYTKETNNKTKLTNELTCMTDKELESYLGHKDGYGWGISDLEIFDEPKELSEFFDSKFSKDAAVDMYRERASEFIERHEDYDKGWLWNDCLDSLRLEYKLKRAPQSYCYIEVD